MDDLFASQKKSQPLSVGEVNLRMRAAAAEFGELEVRGEISDFRGANGSGHLYFTLKDDSGVPASLNVAIWAGVAARLHVLPRNGMKVVLKGRLDVYVPRGNYSLIATSLREEGKGDLMAQYEALKARLAAEGLFDPASKRPVPAFVKTVAFVTAPTGAVIHDFCQLLQNGAFAGTVILVPAKVQGPDAAESIVRGIELANRIRDLDLLVVGRGGGSLEDLWCFNEEIVARAVKASCVPVISAVGHQTDFTLSDFAADLRAETPSAAAEILVKNRRNLLDRLENAAGTLEDETQNLLNLRERDLDLLGLRLEKQSPQNYLEHERLRLDNLSQRLENSRERVFSGTSLKFSNLQTRLDSLRPEKFLETHQSLLEQLEARLRASGIEATLNRGFAVVFNPQKNVPVTSAGTAKKLPGLKIRFKDGEITR
ncbi:MAG: exodeoxyribonuclease VII large subunit [Opitutales bacterium]|nr:exodeoxyribonuclease VII large subunit [Opitutales bacterium]